MIKKIQNLVDTMNKNIKELKRTTDPG